MLRPMLEILTGLFALLFLASSLGKFDSWTSWTAAVDAWRLRSVPVNIIRIGVPSVELSTAAMLILSPMAGLALASAVLLVFTLGVLLLIPRHRGEDCGCFGAHAKSSIGMPLALRNVFLGSTAIAGALLARRTAPWALSTEALMTLLVLAAGLWMLAEALIVQRAIHRAGEVADRE